VVGAQNIKNAVKVPAGESLNEWLTIHVIDFYNDVALLYGILTEYCTNQSCPVMSAGPKYK
jgi:MOB kinase activator 1